MALFSILAELAPFTELRGGEGRRRRRRRGREGSTVQWYPFRREDNKLLPERKGGFKEGRETRIGS
jgi:hypothetical protein